MAQKNYKKIIDKSNIKIKLTQFKNFNTKLNNYNSKTIFSNKIVNCLMLNGKKSLAEKIFYKIFNLLQKVSLKNSKIILKFALLNVSPIMTVFKKKK